ncbi:MAG TPA: Ppx/GppA family phosphatase [Myxococcota bacterium]|nr:Ppx/GppA family phosphatase [Myxococcota bacterium]
MGNGGRLHPSRIGVLDVGSNTVLLLVLGADGAVLRDEARITRLGQGVFARGELAPEAVARTRAAIADFARIARAESVARLVAVGTEALRRAREGAEFLAALVRDGLVDGARLLSGEEEAELTLEATRRQLGQRRGALAVIDVGGGSTEVAWRESLAGPVRGVSLPLGSVRLTEAHLPRHPIPAADLAALRETVRAAARPLLQALPAGLPADAAVVAVAGTATTLAALELELAVYRRERVEGLELSRAVLSRWIEKLAQLGVAERKRLPGLEPGRADVIVAGLVCLELALACLRAERFTVSEHGVRHGVALRMLAGDPLI